MISPSCLFEIRHRPFLWCLDWAISPGLYVSDVGVYFVTLFALITINVLVRMCCGDLASFEFLCFRCFVKSIFMFRLSFFTLFHSGVLGDFAELPV